MTDIEPKKDLQIDEAEKLLPLVLRDYARTCR